MCESDLEPRFRPAHPRAYPAKQWRYDGDGPYDYSTPARSAHTVAHTYHNLLRSMPQFYWIVLDPNLLR